MNSDTTFEQWVMKTFDKSVYQIALEVAQGYVTNASPDPGNAWMVADDFIKEMRKRHESARGTSPER